MRWGWAGSRSVTSLARGGDGDSRFTPFVNDEPSAMQSCRSVVDGRFFLKRRMVDANVPFTLQEPGVLVCHRKASAYRLNTHAEVLHCAKLLRNHETLSLSFSESSWGHDKAARVQPNSQPLARNSRAIDFATCQEDAQRSGIERHIARLHYRELLRRFCNLRSRGDNIVGEDSRQPSVPAHGPSKPQSIAARDVCIATAKSYDHS
jgi:hypothetical protein